MACSGGEGSTGYGGIAEINLIIETGGTKMNGVRGWHGGGIREISHRWGGYKGCRFSSGIGGRQQRVTLGEGYPPDFPLISSIVVFFIWSN